MHIKIYLFLLSILLGSNLWISKNTMSNEIEILETITVTGNLIPKKLKETGSSIKVISKKEIKESGANYLSQILSGTTGFQLYRSGGPHTLSRAFLRGSETDHTLVLINGMKMVDPATGSGSVDLERITLSGIERIEILRGSQSALYGSEAIGGVINIISTRGNKNYEKYINLETSNRLDKNMNTGLSGKIKNAYFSISFNHSEGPGISAAEKSLGYKENDSYNIDNGNFSLDYDLDSNTEISFDTRFFTSEIQEDDAPNGPLYDADMHTNLLDWQSSTSLKKEYNLFSVNVSASTARARRYQLKNDRKFRRYIADLNTGRIKFNFPLSAFDNIVIGMETERSHMEQRTEHSDYDFKVSSTSNFISYLINYYKNFFIDVSLSTNSHDSFGNSATHRIASSYLIPSWGLRFHSSYGTGYRAPTLDEIYGSYGSSTIKEEKSRSRDIGLEYISKNNKFTSDITVFSTQIDNLIGYGAAPDYIFENQGSAKTNGLEFFMNYIYEKDFEINLNYNFLTTNNNGKSLPRRRKHSGKTTFRWTINEYPKFMSYTTIEFYSKARDDAFAGAHLSGYTLIHSNLNYEITSQTNTYVKIENLLDQKYHLSDTAGTYGRTISMGINLNF